MKKIVKVTSIVLILSLLLSCVPFAGNMQAEITESGSDEDSGNRALNDISSLEQSDGILVGYAIAHINPTSDGSVDGTLLRTGLSGYGNESTRIATSIEPGLGLIASVLVVTDSEDDTVVIISCDSASVADTLRNQTVALITAEHDIPAENLAFNSNHQHSTPTGNSAYYPIAARSIANAVTEAMGNRAPAKMSIARAYVNQDENGYLNNGLKFNYVRNYTLLDSAGNTVGMVTDNHSDIGRVSYSKVYHESEADDEVQVVRFEREGASTVLMANFQTHPHLLTSGSSTVVTSDIVGVFRNELEAAMESYDPANDYEVMYISGASGNINAQGRGDAGAWSENSDYARTLEHARLLPSCTFDAITKEGAWTPVKGGNVHVVAETNYYRLILNTIPSRLEGQITIDELVAAAKEVQSKGYSTTYRNNYGIYSKFHANAIVERTGWDENSTKPLSIAAISIGDVAFVTAPYEMFDTNGQEIKAGSPFAMTFVNTLANIGSTTADGHKGYIPSLLGYTNGGYSADITDYIEGTGEVLVADYLDMLQQLKNAPETPKLVHCVCSDPTSTNNPCADAGHIQRTWRLWEDTTTVPYLPGYWYLESDLDLSSTAHNYGNSELVTSTGIVGWDKEGDPFDRNIEVYVDLNGKTVTGKINHRIYRMENNSSYTYSLTITDSVGTGSLISKTSKNSTVQGNVFWLRGSKNELNIYGGTFNGRASYPSSSVYGGTIDSAGRVNMYGGTVLSSSGSAKGNVMYLHAHAKSYLGGDAVLEGTGTQDVYIAATNRISVGGKVQISSVYLDSNAKLLDGGLESDASIGITAAYYGTFLSDPAAEYIKCFKAKKAGTYIRANANGTLAITNSSGSGMTTPDHAGHCVCGDTGCSDHTVLNGEWLPWDGMSAITVGGNYYLTQDVLSGSTQRWIGILNGANGYTVNLCLNGHSITSNHRVFAVATNMTFHVMNCKDTGGELRGCCANNDFGGSFWVQSGGTGAIYDGVHIIGEERTGRTVRNGGAVVVYGTFHMYGGSITGAKVSKIETYEYSGNGGAVYISGRTAHMYLHAGTITGGNAVLGGSVSIDTGGQLTLLGGTIRGGTATDKGGGIYVADSAKVNLGGKPDIHDCHDAYANADIFVGGINLAVLKDGLDPETDLSIYMERPGSFCNASAAYIDCFTGLVDGYSIIANGPYLQFSNANHAPHCDCGNTEVSQGCTHNSNGAAWQEWDGTCSILESGNYYLSQDAFTPAEFYIGDPDNIRSLEITICMNGYSISSEARVFRLVSGVKLSLCSCHSSMQSYLYGSGNAGEGGGVIQIDSGATLKMYPNVNLRFNDTGVGVTQGGCVNNLGQFYMYGGSISNGAVTSGGGNVFVEYNALFNMYSGSISGGITSGSHGGNVKVYGKMLMEGGTISGGMNVGTTSDNCAGNLYLGNNGARVTVTGSAKILGGETEIRGGNVFLYAGNLTVSGNAEITGGTVRSSSKGYGACILQNNLVGSKYSGNIHFDGSPSVTEAYIFGGYITIGNLAENASVGLTKKTIDYLTKYAVSEEVMDHVHSTMSGAILSPAQDGLRLVSSETAVKIDGRSFCFADAVAAAGGKERVITLCKNLTSALSVAATIYLDLNGYNISGAINIASGKTLKLLDNATADYLDSDRGRITGKLTGTVATTLITPESYGHNYRYLALQESDGSWSSHRFYLSVKSASLQIKSTESSRMQTTVSYKTVLKCTDTAAGKIEQYGAMITGTECIYTNGLNGSYTLQGGTENVLTVQLDGTLRKENTFEQNQQNALQAPQVCAYFVLKDGTQITSAIAAYSLKDIIVMINEMSNLTDPQKYALGALYRAFRTLFDSWTDVDLSNIKRY